MLITGVTMRTQLRRVGISAWRQLRWFCSSVRPSVRPSEIAEGIYIISNFNVCKKSSFWF